MTFCLLPKHADDFLEKVKSGEFDGAKLSAMSSAERNAAFAKVLGDENASRVNAAFESKLLLKNQQAGIQTWIEKTAGLKPDVKRDMLTRVERMENVLEPKDLHSFLADLAQQKLGVGVTMQEAGKISELAKATADAKASGDWEKYVDARVAFREYVGDITPHAVTSPLSKEALTSYVRAGALSWPTTIAKLTSVALSRMVTTPITDAVALGVSKALPALAEGAPRYGTTSGSVAMQSEIAAQTAQWTDGLIDSKRMLQNKASRLDLMHGDKAQAHAWYEYFGSLHGALKEPIKRAEYARSLYRRTVEAESRGEDVKDMTTRLRLSTEAYLDGQRAVSMNDNAVSSAWNAGLRRLEQPDNATGKPTALGSFLSTVARVEMPIMKAPTNVVLEASEYIGGLLTGGSKAAWHYAKGLEGLAPVERDAVIRQISKGTVGAAIMALYYFKHDKVEFGGFYQPGEHRKPEDVPAGGARIGGTTISKTFLHNPMLDAGQFAASVARVSSSKLRKSDADPQGVASATGAAALGLINEVPVIGSLPKDIQSLSDPKTRGGFIDRKVASIAVPGVVQWIAKQTDDTGDVKRDPKGITQSIEAGLPGLRRSVPEKAAPGTPRLVTVAGKQVQLSGEDRAALSKQYGTQADQTLAELAKDKDFTAAPPDEQKKIVKGILREKHKATMDSVRGAISDRQVPAQASPAAKDTTPPGVPYEKSGHPVIDTPRLDAAGHVPTHRLDQATNRRIGESWTQYEDRVLSQPSSPKDTEVVRDLGALQPDVRSAATSLIAAAAREGVTLTPNETARPQARQEALFRKGRSEPGEPVTWTLTSDHTPGRAIDFRGDSKAYAWLSQNAPRFGFSTLGDMDPGHVSMPQTTRTVARIGK